MLDLARNDDLIMCEACGRVDSIHSEDLTAVEWCSCCETNLCEACWARGHMLVMR